MGRGLGMNGGHPGGTAEHTAAEAPDPAVRPRSKVCRYAKGARERPPVGRFSTSLTTESRDVAGTRKASSKPAKSLEATLWDAADKLRGNLEASEYKHVVLGLVFLKYVSDAFTARRLELEAALADPDSADHIPSQVRRERILESRDE